MNRLLTLSLLASGFLCAQNSTNPPNPATIAQRRVEMLTNRLGLNSSQQQQATTIFTNEATANAPIQASLQSQRQSLAAAEESNNTSSIGQIATQIGNLTAQLTTNSANANAAFYQILNSDQQSKYAQTLNRGGAGFGPAGRFRRQR